MPLDPQGSRRLGRGIFSSRRIGRGPQSPVRRSRRGAGSRRTGSTLERLEPRSMLAADAAADPDMHLDHDGHEYCAMPLPPSQAAAIAPPVAAPVTAPLSETFKLHSRPSASKVIYLDFNGHTTSNTAWNSGTGSFTTPAYDYDGNPAFSDRELTTIQNVWAQVVEDFVPFDVDVTTEDPGVENLRKSGAGDTRWGVRVVIGGSYTDWYKSPAGGVAYVGSFTWDSDTPCFVFGEDYGSWGEDMAEAITHEAGHTLGLSHDGRTTPSEGYYAGHGTGATSWAPIMGVGYGRSVVQWSKGEYLFANNKEDDLAIITTKNGFDYRSDDYGSTTATAFRPVVVGGTAVNLAGVIERNTDVDVFRFATQGILKATIRPADVSPDLDVLAEIWDAKGNVVSTSNPLSTLDASFDLTVPSGVYYLAIRGTGYASGLTLGYTTYASLGQYTVAMTIQGDVTPPAPPVIVSVDDDFGTLTGPIASGGRTDDATPRLSGTAEPGSTVKVYDGATPIGTTTTDDSGTWIFTTPSLTEGLHSFAATATDQSDNASGLSSPAWQIVVDRTPPLAPVIRQIYDDVPLQVGVVPNGGIANDPTPTLSGTAEGSANVRIFDGSAFLGSTQADSFGNWTFVPAPLVSGRHSFTAGAIDQAGLVGPSSGAYVIVIDAVAPPQPTILAVLQDSTGAVSTVSNGGRTGDATPTVTGTAEPAATVSVFDGGELLGTTVADSAGKWSYTTSGLAEGRHVFTASSTDAVGNVGAISSSYAIVLDLTAPVVPGLASVVVDAGPWPGIVPNGGRTTDRTLAISGTAPAATIVRVVSGSLVVGSTVADAGGAWSLTTSPLADGTYLLQAVTVDDVGNASAGSVPAYVVTVDTLPPEPASIRRVADDIAPRTGEVTNGGSTNDSSPNLSGSAEAGAAVTVLDNGIVLGTAIADPSGTWTLAPTGLAEGWHVLTTLVTDATGNVGGQSAAFAILVDTAAPAAPAITGVARTPAAGGLPVANGGRTRDNVLAISGVAEARGTVTVYDSGVVLGTVSADATGLWTLTTGALPEGTRLLTASVTDASGNPSAVSSPAFVVTIDLTAPGIPVILAAYDDVAPGLGDVATGGYTNDATLRVSGTTDPLVVVKLFANGVLVGSTTADAAGGWSIVTAPLPEGWVRLAARSVDDLGNESLLSALERVVWVKTTTPVPAIVSAGDDLEPLVGSVSNGGATNDSTLAIAGVAEPGVMVTIYDGGAVIGYAAADLSGAWRLVTAALADGRHELTASATDAVGNTSGRSAVPFVVFLDTVAPATPGISAVLDESVSPAARIGAGGFCRGDQLRVSGVAQPGTTVTVMNGTTLVGTAPADAVTGEWSLRAWGGGNGPRAFTAIARDAAGNASAASVAYAVTVDTIAPAVPLVLAVLDDVPGITGQVSAGGVTNDAAPAVSGTGEPLSVVYVLDGGRAIGAVLVDAAGRWAFTPSSLADGGHSITAVAEDAAGNKSVASAPAFGLRIDSTAPAVLGFLATGPSAAGGRVGVGSVIEVTARLSEDVPAGAVLRVRFDSGAAATLRAAAQGTTLVGTFIALPGQDTERLRVVSVDRGDLADLAGNPLGDVSPSVGEVVAVAPLAIDTKPPQLVGFSTTAVNGRYEAGRTIPLVAEFSENVRPGTVILATLSSGATVTLTTPTGGRQLAGTYVVDVGQTTPRLEVKAVRFPTGSVLDLVGNAQPAAILPGPAGTLAQRGIVVDGTLRLIAEGGRLADAAAQAPDRRGAVTTIALTFSSPITGLRLDSLRILSNGRSVSLAGATLSGSGANYTLQLPRKMTEPKGLYTVQVVPGRGVAALSNAAPLTQTLQLFWGNGQGVAPRPTPATPPVSNKALAFAKL